MMNFLKVHKIDLVVMDKILIIHIMEIHMVVLEDFLDQVDMVEVLDQMVQLEEVQELLIQDLVDLVSKVVFRKTVDLVVTLDQVAYLVE